MVTIKQAIDDLKKAELIEFDDYGNMISGGNETICTTSGELIILLERLAQLEKQNDELKKNMLIKLKMMDTTIKGVKDSEEYKLSQEYNAGVRACLELLV